MKRIVTIAIVLSALAAVLTFSTTEAKGKKPAAKTVTFTKDVAPILFKNCAQCHQPEDIAPFSVLSYKDVRPWAKSIREKSSIVKCRPGMLIHISGNSPTK